ncbi:hypothetical protein [Streptomyces mirabilis]|uniref:hypothetical protein n=1 Tax=Streptomyces mirabilis TaxID=68239 RepID=UPI00331AFEEC
MSERGIDISPGCANPWTDEILRAADGVVSLGCGDACPVFPGKRSLDWTLDSPGGRTLYDLRPIRDDIERRDRGLLDDLGDPAQHCPCDVSRPHESAVLDSQLGRDGVALRCGQPRAPERLLTLRQQLLLN